MVFTLVRSLVNLNSRKITDMLKIWREIKPVTWGKTKENRTQTLYLQENELFSKTLKIFCFELNQYLKGKLLF